MKRRIIQLSNLIEAIESGLISISHVENKTKISTDVTETDQITPEKFLESVKSLNEAKLFRNGIDFFYEFTGTGSVHIQCGMKNCFLEDCFSVECTIRDGVSPKEISAKFRETIFDRMDKKIAV